MSGTRALLLRDAGSGFQVFEVLRVNYVLLKEEAGDTSEGRILRRDRKKAMHVCVLGL